MIGFITIVIFFIAAALIAQIDNLIIQFGNPNITSVNDIGGALHLSPALASFVPTIMTLAFAAILPLTVSWSDRFLGHRTRSEENHSIMKKTFWYEFLHKLLLCCKGVIFKIIFNLNKCLNFIYKHTLSVSDCILGF